MSKPKSSPSIGHSGSNGSWRRRLAGFWAGSFYPNLAIFVIGFGLGVLQWFVLQNGIRKARMWILVTAVGWSAEAAITSLFVPDGIDFLAGIVDGLATGWQSG